MKKIGSLFLAILCILTGVCGCGTLNQQPVTLADSVFLSETGVVEASVFAMLKAENKAVTFQGTAGELRYEWVVFGRDIREPKDINLGIEITQSGGSKVAFRFLSKEEFGFCPTLSIYLDTLWNGESAAAAYVGEAETDDKQAVAVSGRESSVLSFSPKRQTGAVVIVPGEQEEPAAEEKTNAPPTSSQKGEQTHTQSAATAGTGTAPSMAARPTSGGEDTKQDQYSTDPVPAGKPLPAEPDNQTIDTRKSYTCTFSIECSTIFQHLSDLEPEKLDVLPKSGVLFSPQTVTFYEGESVYDVLQRICQENKIHMEVSFTPMYNSAYIEGIGNLYEFDCGSGSGWMYRVDGWYPNYGCSRYQLKQGEKVEWRFTCDFGHDIGGRNIIGG